MEQWYDLVKFDLKFLQNKVVVWYFFGQNHVVIKCMSSIITTKIESGSAAFEAGRCICIVPTELSSSFCKGNPEQ